MRDAIQVRSMLVPYIYTAARITFDEGARAIVRPMYYEYPCKYISIES
jgi:alpha-glucosidase (family GH31 glycosyl hydrolase)